jgi:heterodisulfide reductase subunit C
MDLSPRQVIAMFRAGEMEQLMKSRTIWICASCYACTTRCPSGIAITDIIYALKRTAMDQKMDTLAPQVRRLATLFTDNIMRYGRLHEGTLIRKYAMRTNPLKLFGYIPLAVKLWKTKRLEPFPKRIRGHRALARIIRKAQEIDMRHIKASRDYSPEFVGYRGLGQMELEQRKGE